VGKRPGHRRVDEPDWGRIRRELQRKHVTLSILWDEYIAEHPDGYRYSRFCELYRSWEARLPVTMRQTHASGEKLFVDYAGDTVPVVIDRLTGETRAAQIFVAVLAAHRASPMLRRPGPRPCRTGSRRIIALWQQLAACRRCWCPTTPGSRSSAPASTIHRSTGPTPIWRAITARPFSRRGRGRVTRRRSRWRFCWRSGGCWASCATGHFTASPN
ncbi:unnamed protein product, partial [Acidocella sp. C78]